MRRLLGGRSVNAANVLHIVRYRLGCPDSNVTLSSEESLTLIIVDASDAVPASKAALVELYW
jgi:hypothetical protein